MRRVLLVTISLAGLYSRDARAQDRPAGTASAEVDNATLAQQRYQRGITLYQTNEFGPALTEFRAAMAIFGSPNSRLYVARCLRGLGRLADAVAEYELTAREASDRAANEPRYLTTREAATNEMRALLPQVGRITLHIDPAPPGDARVTVGGREIPAEGVGLSIPVMPGRVAIEVSAPGYQSVQREAIVQAQQTATLQIQLVPGSGSAPREGGSSGPADGSGSSAAGPLRPAAYGAFAVGVAGVVALGIFGTLASQQYNDLFTRCGGMRCPEAERGNVATGRGYTAAANIGLAVGIVGIAAGAVLYVLSRNSAPSRVRIGSTGTLLTLTGNF